MIYRIIETLVKRPLLSKLILVFIVFSAVAAVLQVKQFAYPRVDMLQLNITTVYPGAAPEDVELNVTAPIEEALKGIDGISSYRSQSLENSSLIDVRIDHEVEDPDRVKDEIRRAVDSVTGLPENAERPSIHEVKVDNFPIFELAVTSDTADVLTLRKYTLDLEKELLALEPVSRIELEGVPDPEIRILADPDRMKRNYISFDDIIESVRLNKLRLSGGSLESYTTRTTIVTMSEFDEARELGDLVLRANEFGYQTLLSDVAEIEQGVADRDILVTYDGRPGMAIDVKKKGTADTIYAANLVKETLEIYKKEKLPEEIEILIFYDASVEIKDRLSTVYYNAIFGFVLVLFALFFFLDTRVAMWTAIGIPFAVMIAFIAVPFFGLTINSISLIGIIVVLGMLVDDAIIVSESIYREREKGLPPLEASISGLKKVISPVMTTIATTIIAFMPIFFLPGMAGEFAAEVPAFVILLLIGSLIESTILLPAHLAEERSSGEQAADKKKPLRIKPGQRLLNVVEQYYKKILALVFRYRIRTVAIALLVLISGLGAGSWLVSFRMYPLAHATDLWIYGETDARSTLNHTQNTAKRLEGFLAELPDGTVSSYKLTSGRRFEPGSFMIVGENQFSMGVILVPASERDMSAVQVKNYILSRVEEEGITGFSKLDYYIDAGGPPAGKPLEIRISGRDTAGLQNIIREVQSELNAFPVTEVDSNYREGKEEIRVIPSYRELARTGLSSSAVASTIRTAFNGTEVTELRTASETIPVRLGLPRQHIDEDDPLRGLFVRNPFGNLIPVSALASTEKSLSPESVFRYNGQRTYTISANIDLDVSTPEEIYSSLKRHFSDFQDKHPGYTMSYGGEAEQDAGVKRDMGIAIAVAIIAIYFLLVIQFNSFAQPFMVLAAVPFGMLGILSAFIIHGMDLSLLALIGVLGFTGVVINDSLVMVHFMNYHKGKANSTDEKFYDLLIAGAGERLRPILLTTITTVAGLVPTAYGFIGGFDAFISPMVMAMTWGLVTGTFSILFIVPVLYSLIEQLRVGHPAAK